MNRTIKMVAAFMIALCIALSLSGCAQWAASEDFDKGIAYFNQGNYEAAIPYFQKATTTDPEYVDAYMYLGRSHLNLRQWTKAISPLRTAYRLAPDKTKGLVQDLIMDAILGAASQGIRLDK
ncbi:MAG: hypothetical protein FD164_466 [Nitrospirae bacterium]|nr:MAG: hypothetical protein FD164_466 [Nitrospirota bacterium]